MPIVCECNLLLTRKTMPKYEANNFWGRPQKSFAVHYENESFFNVIATMPFSNDDDCAMIFHSYIFVFLKCNCSSGRDGDGHGHSRFLFRLIFDVYVFASVMEL